MSVDLKASIMTPKFRVSFPNVFRPGKPVEAGKEPKYSIVMLFEKGADMSALVSAVNASIVAKWGSDKNNWPKKLKTPFKDQGSQSYSGYEAGAYYLQATSKDRPGLVDARNEDIIDESEFYAGCYARATVGVFTYDKGVNLGVGFGLRNIQKLADGEPLSGRLPASKEFTPVEEAQGAGMPMTADMLFSK